MTNIRVLPAGENSRLARRPQRKLTAEQVVEAKAMLAGGARQVDVAAKFGVSQVAVSHLKRGKSYA